MSVISSGSAKDSKDSDPNPYDEVPYESFPFPSCHPDQLATIAKLFGLSSPPVEHCRVLDLGCASGGHLIPLAYTFPDSQFVGVDFSIRQIIDGKNQIDALGLKNIELRQMDILDIDSTLGLFDYIIVHGIYSWVPPNVQEKILQICNENLGTNGVAIVSYNTFPGWHARGMIRSMMLYHTSSAVDLNAPNSNDLSGGLINTSELTGPGARVGRAREFANFLYESVSSDGYGLMLKKEIEELQRARDSYFLHEHLEGLNDPIYFHKFVEKLAKHGMKYLGDATFSSMISTNLGTAAHETLQKMSSDFVMLEQYMDFLRNRTFRQSLLCHQNAPLSRALNPNSLVPFFISSDELISDTEINLDSEGTHTLRHGKQTVVIRSPITKAAFKHLLKIAPASIKFESLVEIAKSAYAKALQLEEPSFEFAFEALGAELLYAFGLGVISLHTVSDRFVTELSERPVASLLARQQSRKEQGFSTNQRHQAMYLNVFQRQVLELLDGNRDLDQIRKELLAASKAGKFIMQKNGANLDPTTDEAKVVLYAALDNTLIELAKLAFLIA